MIRACLFDMGKVLVEFSHARMLEQMALVCRCEATVLREFLFDSGLLLQYEKGLISEDELHRLLEERFGGPLDQVQLHLAAADIFQEKEEMIPLLEELRRLGQRLVLLSNTSRVHFEFIRERFGILDHFDAYVLSYETNSLKPEPAIYAAAVELAGYPAAQCFFTDDILENVEAARQFGLQAEQFFHREQLIRKLQELSIPVQLVVE